MRREWLMIAASVACLGCFAWALRSHFRRDGRVPVGMRLLSAASLISFSSYVWELCRFRPRLPLALLGVALFSVSISLFWWAVATTRTARPLLAYVDLEPSFIQTSGPYRLVRHPFYMSYIIFWLGTAVIAGGVQWLSASILITWYVLIARREERRFSESRMNNAYKAYSRRTGMWLPTLRISRRHSSNA